MKDRAELASNEHIVHTSVLEGISAIVRRRATPLSTGLTRAHAAGIVIVERKAEVFDEDSTAK
jgi:hypothetical protein